MPLPIADCADDIPEDVCCTTLFDVADQIRCTALNAVMDCIDPDTCTDRPFRSYVTIGDRPEDYLGDCIIVSMSNLALPSSYPFVIGRAEFGLTLYETGWPTIELDDMGDAIYFPPSDLVNAAARHAYSHAERMWRGLADRVARKTLLGNVASGRFSNVMMSGLAPLPPSGTLIGWEIMFTVDIDFSPTGVGS